MANDQKSYRDKRGRFTQTGAKHFGKLGGETSREVRRNKKNKRQSESNMNSK